MSDKIEYRLRDFGIAGAIMGEQIIADLVSDLEAAEKRIAELEAQLAAQAWRPVTEKPTEPGTYLVYDADGEPYLFAGVWPYRVARWDNGWGSGLDGLVDYWRPLPAPPIDPPAATE